MQHITNAARESAHKNPTGSLCYTHELSPDALSQTRLRVCAVSFLNTCPLVWGMLRGPQRDIFDLNFDVPSACADRLAREEADIGIVPVVEAARQNLEIIPGNGIACHAAVRSILLVSKAPIKQIRTLAADSNSRTSVMLARVLLAGKWGVEPEVVPFAPDLARMLESADAALLIGDSALHVNPREVPFTVIDLGAEWTQWTGLPMVFAVWAGRGLEDMSGLETAFRGSCRFGLEHLEEIVAVESAARGFTQELVREYLTRNIVLELTARDYEGMRAFLELASRFDILISPGALAI